MRQNIGRWGRGGSKRSIKQRVPVGQDKGDNWECIRNKEQVAVYKAAGADWAAEGVYYRAGEWDKEIGVGFIQ